jgi:hypothetical protein
MSLIIGVGVVLVLAIFYMIFRIGNLVGLVKNKKDDIESGNAIHGYLFTLKIMNCRLPLSMVSSRIVFFGLPCGLPYSLSC